MADIHVTTGDVHVHVIPDRLVDSMPALVESACMIPKRAAEKARDVLAEINARFS